MQDKSDLAKVSKIDANQNADSPPNDDASNDNGDSPFLAQSTPTRASKNNNNLSVISAERKSSTTPLETLRQSLATTRPLPTFRSSPDILLQTDDEDEELFSDTERQLIATDSVTAKWKDVDNIYIGQLFTDYNVIPIGLGRSESPSPQSTVANKTKVRINNYESERSNTAEEGVEKNGSENDKNVPSSAADKKQEKKKVPFSGADSDAYASADETKDAFEKNGAATGAQAESRPLDIESGDPLIAAAQRNEPFDTTKCTTDSRIKEERLYARRYRIKQSKIAEAKIADHLMSLAAGEEHEPKDLMKEHDLSMAHAQIERSDKQVFNVFEEGEVILTNFTAGARKRYTQRRRYMQNELEKIRLMLEEEQMLFKERYAAITERWPKTAEQKEQLNSESLQTLLDEQKAACAERLELKQRVIQRLQDSLRLIDEHYAKSLRKQEQDLTDLSGNYQKVFRKLLTGFHDEMHAVEDVLYEDLHAMKEQFCVSYEDLRNEKTSDEVSVIDKRTLLKEEFDNELDGLRWTEADKFDILKKKLESDVHTIEQQLMLMKAGFQMNAEKLDYNYQVLKRRDEENTILKAKQKRRITRLQDLLTKLRERQRKQDQVFQHDVESLTGDCSRLAQQIVDLHNKSKHFEKSDVEQFRNVWLVDELDIRYHVHHLLLIDRVISQQILGLDWQPPDMVWCCTEIGPIVAKKWAAKQQDQQRKSLSGSPNDKKSSLSKKRASKLGDYPEKSKQKVQIILPESPAHLSINNFNGTVNAHLNFTSRTREELFDAFHEINVQKKLEHYFVKLDDDPNVGVERLRNVSPILLAHLFERIASETGYMVESKIVPIIDSMAFYEQKHQKFVKFDSVLRALGVGTSNDVLKLAEYFVKQLPPDVLQAHTTFSSNEKEQKKKKTKSDKKSNGAVSDVPKVQISEPPKTAENDEKPEQTKQVRPNSAVSLTDDATAEENDTGEVEKTSSSTFVRDESADSPKKRRELKPSELNELGLTLPTANMVISPPKQRHRKALTKSRAVLAATMPPNLSPLERARWIKEQQQALATVEADDTNIAAIIQEENELISNATVRENEEAKKRRHLSPLKREMPSNEDEDVAETEMSTAKSELSSSRSPSRKLGRKKKSKKKSKKSKRKKSRNRSPKQSALNAAAGSPVEDKADGKVDDAADDNMRLSDYIDPEYGCPDYMRVSEATNEILSDPMLNCLVPLDDVLTILQQFIDDYTVLEEERSKKAASAATIALRSTASKKKLRNNSTTDNGTGVHRNDNMDRPYFEQYLHMLDLELRLPTWRILFSKLHVFYVVMMERIKYRAQHGAQTRSNDTMLDELGALMTSEHAGKLLVPALTTVVGDYRKRSKLLGNWKAGGDVDVRVLAKQKSMIKRGKQKKRTI